MKQAGFYACAADVLAAVSPTRNSWEPLATRYLEEGAVVVASPSWVDDMLNGDIKRICRYSVLTDGEWVWPSCLVYYVKTYHVAIPVEFLEHMAARNWKIGALDEDLLENIGEQLMGGGSGSPPVIQN